MFHNLQTKNSALVLSFLSALTVLPFEEAASQERFRPEGFRYSREIQGAEEAVQKGRHEYGVIEIDRDLFKHSYGSDIRIANGNKTLPYFIRSISAEEGRKEKKTVKEIFTEKTRSGNVTVLELPEIPPSSCYTSIAVHSDRDFESGIRIQLSGDAKQWNSAGYRSIFQYDGPSEKFIHLECTEYRYVRLTAENAGGLRFPYVHISEKKKEKTEQIDIKVSDLKIRNNSDLYATQIYFPNEDRIRLQRIIMSFQEERYSRRYEVYRKNPESRKYEFFTSGWISSAAAGENQILDLPYRTPDPLRIDITNDDDESLELKSFSVLYPGEEIVFLLPVEIQKEAARIYYGSRYAFSPAYDIKETYDADLPHARMSLSPHEPNSVFAYSLIEPPLSIWIIRILFLLGLGGILYPAWKIFETFRSDMEKLQKQSGDS